MRKGLILVEGQTEEQFVKQVLNPYLWTRGLHLQPTLAVTKRIKDGPNFRGGLSSFAKIEPDIRALLGDTSAAIVTTMVDLYALPKDFPGLSSAELRRGADKAEWIRDCVEQHFGRPEKFRPFITVHEYEGLLFSDPRVLADVLAQPSLGPSLAEDRRGFATPEDINEGPNTHPSERILRCCASYRKRLHGLQAIERIGLEHVRTECPHFGRWIADLETAGEQ